eukprot:SAG11_NODE_1526_length_4741_cov_1.622576_2_plen_310_part_00
MLPTKFASDTEGKKAQWREAFRLRLAELLELEAAGKISATQRRHSAYQGLRASRVDSTRIPQPSAHEEGGTADEAQADGSPMGARDSDGYDEGELLLRIAAQGPQAAVARRLPFAVARLGASSCHFEQLQAVPAFPRLANTTIRNSDQIRGNCAVVERGDCSFAVKARYVLEAGAAALLFVNSDDELFTVSADADTSDAEADALAEMPIVLLRRSEGALLLKSASPPTEGSQSRGQEGTDEAISCGACFVDLSFTRWPTDDESEGTSDSDDSIRLWGLDDSDDGGWRGATDVTHDMLMDEIRMSAVRRE